MVQLLSLNISSPEITARGGLGFKNVQSIAQSINLILSYMTMDNLVIPKSTLTHGMLGDFFP